jgi:hypothetical protein
MIGRRALMIIACAGFAASAAPADSAVDPAKVRAATFYAAGLELPLMELRRGVLLARSCHGRLRLACTREQRALAASSHTLALLDALTLFPERPADDPGDRAMSATALRERIIESGARLMRTAADYDRALIARYGAALRVCPGDFGPGYRESLEALTAVDLRQFQGLDGADYDAARRQISDAEAAVADALRTQPAEDCAAALDLGQLLMEMMNAKLEPWTRENRRMADANRPFDFDAALKPPADDSPTRDIATSIAGNFVTLVATELQLTVFPETGARVKALADSENAAGN